MAQMKKRVEESQTTTVEKHGPFGYQTGQQWSMMLEPCENFRELIIKTGAIVDALTFVTTKTRQKFGGDGGNAEHKVTLQPGEYITNVSGWIGEWHENRCLTKLRIHTNLCTDGYGPFGGGPYTNYLSEFHSQVPSDGSVVGIFGTIHGNYVESIGLYVKQEIEPTVKKYGPFGYQTGQQWSIMLEPCENFKEIIINTGAIVDALTFITTKTSQKFGGDGGNAEHKVTLQPEEFITNLSGWIGEWDENRCLTKLKIHTNLRSDGYGPFGGGPYTNYLSEFHSQVPSDGSIVGFFGTIHGNYVESIGLYVKQ